ncbi:MAG: methyltransferase domain-containing protein [Acidobacteriia bacterium]|nr:methyltransferase domain-containing protein [Terriglobia bacterium]
MAGAGKTVVTSDLERGFYDGQYAQFLTLPDHALRIDRQVLEGNIESPAHPFYERAWLYRASMRALEAEPLPGRKVLDYGCGPADFGIWMATEGAAVTLLDLSPTAVELGLKRAQASGVDVRGIAADASCLNMLGPGEFDLVFACAALHHTLKYPGAVEELARIMKPGSRLVLCETWGGNPLLNTARKLHAAIRGEAAEQGEDIILSQAELRALAPFFSEVRVETRNLLAMGKRLLRGRFEKPWARALVRALERIDGALLALAPPLRNWCGEAVITARRK